MPMMRLAAFLFAGVTLGYSWLGPMPAIARHSFAAHMTMHMAVVAIAAPLIALTVAGTRIDPVRRIPHVLAPIPLSMAELVVVWVWHVPALHEAARQETAAFVLEQVSFLGAGALLWLAAMGGDHEQRRIRAGGGVTALLFTSMHMTLLGALFAIAGRPLFEHAASDSSAAAVANQQLGGVIMLLVGGASYLAGGLWLTAVALRGKLTTVSAVKERPS
jgi:putative membrane protein